METLKLDKSTAKEIFRDKKTPDSLKKILIDTFGEKCFSERITDQIKTFEDACKALVIDPLEQINGNDLPDESAYKKLKLIIRVLNEGWVPDWSNFNQAKYYPWFAYSRSSGFGFSRAYYGYSGTYTCIGSRLCFKSCELAEYAGKQFIDIYREYLT